MYSSEDSDTNQPASVRKSFDLYLVSRVLSGNPRPDRIADEAEGEAHGKKNARRARSKREDTSVTHESKSNNTAKSCINHPR